LCLQSRCSTTWATSPVRDGSASCVLSSFFFLFFFFNSSRVWTQGLTPAGRHSAFSLALPPEGWE
jgi:hypothetical protein